MQFVGQTAGFEKTDRLLRETVSPKTPILIFAEIAKMSAMKAGRFFKSVQKEQ